MSCLFDDASDQYLAVGSVPLAGPPATIACRFQLDDLTNSQALVTLQNGSGVNYIWLLYNQPANSVRIICRDSDDSEDATAGGDVSINTWHHACAVLPSDSSRSAFLDGANKATDTNTVAPAGLDGTFIGRLNLGSPYEYFISGLMAEVTIWDVALTDPEVTTAATVYSHLFVRPANIVAHWSLIRAPYTDIVGGRTLTAYNSPVAAPHPRLIQPAPPLIPSPTAAVAAAWYRHMGMTGVATRFT